MTLGGDFRGDRWIFGCGYLGSRVAELWTRDGWRVHVVTRSAQKAQEFAGRGWFPQLGDPTRPLQLSWTPQVDAVLFALGFDRQGDATIFDVHVGALKQVINALPMVPRVWLHVGTTGVYGDAGGDVVDETSACFPDRDGGRAAWEAEEIVRNEGRCGPAIVLRMAGLYGPGRVPNVEPLRRGEPLAANPEGWLNLIQIDDAAQAINLAASDGRASTYVVSDGSPVLRRDYYSEVARLAGIGSVSFAPASMTGSKAARSLGSKRVDSSKIRQQLGFTPVYPSYREGLAGAMGQVE